jgi:hypothetical protein
MIFFNDKFIQKVIISIKSILVNLKLQELKNKDYIYN